MKTTFKKNILSLVISTCLLAMFSQTTQARSTHNAQGGANTESILNRMDFDKNGEVTSEDFVNRALQRADKHFSRQDKDADELLSEEELSHKRSSRKHRSMDESIDEEALKECVESLTGLSLKVHLSAEERFNLIDSDGSGSITFEEFSDHKATHAIERFTGLDSDENALISVAEVEAYLAERKALHEARSSCIDEQLLMDEN
ncbi:MAG: hypothetical protein GQ582_00715 [Methyloprofundus sp.]|nr:hypothetical protein [Methyloprofundus sp.]